MKYHLPLLLLSSLLHADTLYETDFDNFPTGKNQWAGTDGWISNDTSSGAQAIDADLIPALLQTASLGFNQPLADLTFVALNLGYDHLATENPIVEIDTILGIEDSTTNRRDDFFLSIYNSDGNRLASIRFDNQDPNVPGSQFGIWRENGTNQFDTRLDFIPGTLFNLFITLNLETNTWSADIGGNPLFENSQFTNTAHPVNLGFVAFEWDLSALFPLGHGDNFLVVADLIVRSVVADPNPPFVVTHAFDASNDLTLSWPTSVGFDDQVQFSTDLETWQNTLPNSTFDKVTSSSTVSFTDTSAPRGPHRFYRVWRRATSN